jgi:hypothetical protein
VRCMYMCTCIYVFSERILLTANKGMLFFRGKNDRPRKLTKPAKRSATATYFVPAPLLPHIERCWEAMSALDGASNADDDDAAGGGSSSRTRSLIEMKLVPIRAGDEVPLKRVRYCSTTR